MTQYVVSDGPYPESKEWIIGCWIIEAPHLGVALRPAAQGSTSRAQLPGP